MIIISVLNFSFAFSDMIKWKNDIMHKDALVTEATALSQFIICLQLERAKVSLAVFLDAKSGKATDLSEEYAATDRALNSIKWREFGQDKIFENKLRFQIRIDDFRWNLQFKCPFRAINFVVFFLGKELLYLLLFLKKVPNKWLTLKF